jgi:glycosyltransferase involved in cell wall biosynthesis
MVRDELDVIGYTLRHLASEGFDCIWVADNGSVDGTQEFVRSLSLSCPVHVSVDPEVGYYQSRKMSALVEKARLAGADWVLPFDADELWWARGRSIRQAVEEYRTELGARYSMGAELHNYFPMSTDDPNPNPFRRILHRDVDPAPLPKVLVRADKGVVIHQGNHGASSPGQEDWTQPSFLQVAHFPWRSYDQFERKVRNGYEAYRATDLPEHMGAHWRQYGETLERGGPDALYEIYSTWFQDPPGETVVDPAPYLRYA